MEYRVPELGEGIDRATITRVWVEAGDAVREGQALLDLEADKATVELPAPVSGRVETLAVREGDEVEIGAVLMAITVDAVSVEAETAAREVGPDDETELGGASTAAPAAPGAFSVRSEEIEPPMGNGAPPPLLASPGARRLARESGVNLRLVPGSGRAGRVTAADIQRFLTAPPDEQGPPALPCWREPVAPPLPDFAEWGEIERVPLSATRRAIADRLSLSWRLCPQATLWDHVDITDLETVRRQVLADRPPGSTKLTLTVLAVRAVVGAFQSFPRFNATLDMQAGELVLKRYYHVGIAVDTDRGLLVPVIRHADRKGLDDLARELADLVEGARSGKLSPAAVQGGTFTITNLGSMGGTAFTPLVNYPEVAILGLARAAWQPVVRDGRIEIRLLLPLCLSFDHRVIDGADAARFIGCLSQRLSSDPGALFDQG